MNVDDILLSLKNYEKTQFRTKFLTETIDYFQKLNKKNIIKIEDSEHILAGIRIHTLYHNYLFYLTEKRYKDKYCYRKLTFTDNQASNLVKQICALRKDTDICSCLKKTGKGGTFYVLISENPIKEEADNLLPEKLNNALLGINSLIFLEHQNIDHYCSLYEKHKHKEKIYTEITRYTKIYDKLDNLTKDRVMIHSGLIYHFLGTLYSSDIDILYICIENKEFYESKNIFPNFDVFAIPPDKKIMDFAYKKDWMAYKLPRLGGADDIYTMLINPKYHFYFMGIKCIDIFTAINRTKSRSNTMSIIDIYLMKLYNNINIEMCIKNLTIRQGKMDILLNKLDFMYKKANKLLKEWYNLDVPIEYLKEHFKRCEDLYGTIYRNAISHVDPFIKIQTRVHRLISQHFIKKYGKDANYLLDIGSGKLSDAYIYENLNIKHVYGLEPSMYSIEHAKNKINKYKNVKFNLIHGYGNKEFNLKQKFNVITFIFTIHYMIKNIDTVIKNILKHSNSGTIVIITCINGNRVIEKLYKIDNFDIGFEIKYYRDIYWAVYKIKDVDMNDKMLFYMKDVYGLENGSVENIVDIKYLIDKFEKNNLKLLENKSFEQVYSNIPSINNKYHLKYFQKEILNFNNVLVFKRD